MKATFNSLAFDREGNAIISFRTNRDDALRVEDNFKTKELDLDIKEHRDRRSVNANAYAWVLINKIAKKIGNNPEDTYEWMLRRYAPSQYISVLADVDITPYIKHQTVIGAGHVNGKEFIHYKVYKGSSEMDTQEMSIFIDGIVDEAKDLDIETMTPNELLEMKSKWEAVR